MFTLLTVTLNVGDGVDDSDGTVLEIPATVDFYLSLPTTFYRVPLVFESP